MLIIIHKVLILALTSALNNGRNLALSVWALVVNTENGAFEHKRQRLAIDIVETSKLANVGSIYR